MMNVLVDSATVLLISFRFTVIIFVVVDDITLCVLSSVFLIALVFQVPRELD